MKFYIAARFSRRPECNALAHQLQALGHTITSRWVRPDSDHVVPTGLSAQAADAERERFAREDFEDVLACDAMVSLMEEPRSNTRGGRHVEFGMAVALGKSMHIIGPRETVFHHMPDVCHHTTVDGFLSHPDAATPQAQAAPQAGTVAEGGETLRNKIADLFQIGRNARSDATIIANVTNALHLVNCLMAVERALFTTMVPDEDGEEGDEIEECSVNSWGSEPAQYVEQVRAAIATSPAAPEPVLAIFEPLDIPSALRKLRFVSRVLDNFSQAPVPDRADAHQFVKELIEAVWKSGRGEPLQTAMEASRLEELIHRGALMANTMFNLAQRPGHRLTDAECVLFKSMHIKWDAARSYLAAPIAPAAGASPDVAKMVEEAKGTIYGLRDEVWCSARGQNNVDVSAKMDDCFAAIDALVAQCEHGARSDRMCSVCSRRM